MKKNDNMKGQNNKNLSRRNFIGTVGAASAAFTIIPRHVMAGKGYMQPSDTVNVAGIGVGSMGSFDIGSICDPEVDVSMSGKVPYYNYNLPYNFTPEQLANYYAGRLINPPTTPEEASRIQQYQTPPAKTGKKLANIYALCDVDSSYAGFMFKRYPKAKVYSDWRQMLEKEKSIDAVTISTPDHNHAPIAAAFIREKKHVYVQKPMCKTVYEARILARLAKEYDVVTQMGNQGHATEGTRRVVEWVQGGVVGLVRKVDLMHGYGGLWPQGNLERPPAMAVPKTLNWDLWLGPAPEKPYNPAICHFNWRGLRDYGTSVAGDGASHTIDAPIWALNLGLPSKIQASSSPYNTEYFPQCEEVVLEFPARGYLPPVTLTWRTGGLKSPRPSELEPGRATPGTIYYGDKGIMTSGNGQMPTLIPADEDFQGPDPWLPRAAEIHEDWINAIKNSKKSCNDFSWSSHVTEIFLLFNVAVLCQRSNIILEYDGVTGRFTNSDEANSYLHYEYRQGWTL